MKGTHNSESYVMYLREGQGMNVCHVKCLVIVFLFSINLFPILLTDNAKAELITTQDLLIHVLTHKTVAKYVETSIFS